MMDYGTLVKTGAAVASKSGELQRLRKATNDLEANFMKQMMQEMRKGIKTKAPGQDLGQSSYQDMFDDAVSKSIAEPRPGQKSALGIGEILYRPLAGRILNQAISNPTPTPTTTAPPSPRFSSLSSPSSEVDPNPSLPETLKP